MKENKSARLLFKTVVFGLVIISLNIISFLPVNALRLEPQKVDNNKADTIEVSIYSTYTNIAEGISINLGHW